MKMLGIAGILLGSGEVQDKAVLLCNYFDKDMNKSITRETFSNLLDIMIDVSLRYSPTLAISSLDPNLVHSEKMKEYIRQLEKGEALLKSKSLKEIFGTNEELTRFEFVTMFMANPTQ